MPATWVLEGSDGRRELLPSGAEAASAVLARIGDGDLDLLLVGPMGERCTVVSNGERCLVMVQEDTDDPGRHAVTAEAAGESDGYRLANGQVDMFPDCDTVPLAEALAAVAALVDGRQSPVDWSLD